VGVRIQKIVIFVIVTKSTENWDSSVGIVMGWMAGVQLLTDFSFLQSV
jgi:hypothetical protein